jgi:hypothetical protein
LSDLRAVPVFLQSTLCDVALDRLQNTAPEYNGFLANHGPMAADAMIRLGVGQDVGGWIELYRLDLSDAVPVGSAVTSENWHEHRGRIERLGDWTGYFRDLAADRFRGRIEPRW